MTENKINKGTEDPPQPKTDPLFFNYHEFSAHHYVKIDKLNIESTPSLTTSQPSKHPEQYHETPLVITHFPNVHVPIDSAEYRRTRIVRIPRVFDKDSCPQFSNVLPGDEAGAISLTSEMKNEEDPRFVVEGEYEGQLFGVTSVSPLTGVVGRQEFEEIVDSINKRLVNSYGFSWWRVLEYLLDLFTFWLLSDLFTFSDKRNLQQLEIFIEGQNTKLRDRKIKIISPRRSAYLSLDFQIPEPTIAGLI